MLHCPTTWESTKFKISLFFLKALPVPRFENALAFLVVLEETVYARLSNGVSFVVQNFHNVVVSVNEQNFPFNVA